MIYADDAEFHIYSAGIMVVMILLNNQPTAIAFANNNKCRATRLCR